jgi:hypothetical protein
MNQIFCSALARLSFSGASDHPYPGPDFLHGQSRMAKGERVHAFFQA